MKNSTINLHDLVILIADPNSYERRITQSMLRGFGANKVMEVEKSSGVLQALTGQKIDLLLCDARLPTHGALQLTRDPSQGDNQNRKPNPGDGQRRAKTIKLVRDAGANMVITADVAQKPLRASRLDRI